MLLIALVSLSLEVSINIDHSIQSFNITNVSVPISQTS